MKGFSDRRVLNWVKEVKETSDIKEIAQLLATGKWIAIYANTAETPIFVLGRLSEFQSFVQESK